MATASKKTKPKTTGKSTTEKSKTPKKKTAKRRRWLGEDKTNAQHLVLYHVMQARTIQWITKNVENVPWSPDTIYSWLSEDDGHFAGLFRTAKIKATEAYLDRMLEEIDETTEDVKQKKIPAATVQAVRLKIDTLKWYVAKLAPRIYGTQIDVKLDKELEDVKKLVIQLHE